MLDLMVISLFLYHESCSIYGSYFSVSISSFDWREGEITGPVRAGSLIDSTTALRKETCAKKIGRGKQCKQVFAKFMIASPSFHGGRGALPSAGGHPADLTFLAGGGC